MSPSSGSSPRNASSSARFNTSCDSAISGLRLLNTAAVERTWRKDNPAFSSDGSTDFSAPGDRTLHGLSTAGAVAREGGHRKAAGLPGLALLGKAGARFLGCVRH